MRLQRIPVRAVFAGIFVSLTACSSGVTSQSAASPSPRAAVVPGAIKAGTDAGISLGRNWGPYETFEGTSFRWVANDAQITVRGASGDVAVAIACAGGPNLGSETFALRALDSSGNQVDHVTCTGNSATSGLLLPARPAGVIYHLHADNTRNVSTDGRLLTFRVFGIGTMVPANTAAGVAPPTAQSADIISGRDGVRLGSHWQPIEHFQGLTFRWMNSNDAHILITSDSARRAELHLDVEIGPSVSAAKTAFVVRDASGKALSKTTLTGHQVIAVPVTLAAGESDFIIHVDTQNKPAPHETRLLNLRAMNISLK